MVAELAYWSLVDHCELLRNALVRVLAILDTKALALIVRHLDLGLLLPLVKRLLLDLKLTACERISGQLFLVIRGSRWPIQLAKELLLLLQEFQQLLPCIVQVFQLDGLSCVL